MQRLAAALFLSAIFSGAANAQPANESSGIQVILPTQNCVSTISAGYVFPLPPQFQGLPITWVGALNNNSWGGGYNSSLGLGLDRGGQYTRQSGFPATQWGTFTAITPQLFISNNGPSSGQKNIDPPIIYRAGDLWIAGIDCTASASAYPTYVLGFQFSVPYSASGPPSQPTMVFGPMLTDLDGGNTSSLSTRNLTYPVLGTYSNIRVTFQSSPIAGTALQHASVCVQSSGPNCASAPVPLTFNGGQPGFDLIGQPRALIQSDEISFPFSGGALLIIEDMDTTKVSSMAYEASPFGWTATNGLSGSPGSYYAPGQSYNVQNPSGFASAPTATYGVYSVELWQ